MPRLAAAQEGGGRFAPRLARPGATLAEMWARDERWRYAAELLVQMRGPG